MPKKSKIPLEYFLPLLKANSDGEIVGERKLPTQTAQALHALRISDTQLKTLRAKLLHNMQLLHEPELESHQRAKQQAQACARTARFRQKAYPANVEPQQKARDKFVTRMRLRRQAYRNQEQQVEHWVPPYYKDGRFDVEALGQTLRSQLPGLIPTFVKEVAWIDKDGQFIPAPSTPKLSKEKLKQDETFRDFVIELYVAFYSWCPPQRKEAKVFAKKFSPFQHAMRVRYNKAAEDLTVAIINHVVPTLRYTPSDLRYIFSRDKLTEKQRLSVATSEQRSHSTNTPSEDLEEIRRKTYEASLLGPIG